MAIKANKRPRSFLNCDAHVLWWSRHKGAALRVLVLPCSSKDSCLEAELGGHAPPAPTLPIARAWCCAAAPLPSQQGAVGLPSVQACYCLEQPGHKGSRNAQQRAPLPLQMCGTAGGGLQGLICISPLPGAQLAFGAWAASWQRCQPWGSRVLTHCSTNHGDWFRILVRSLTGFQHHEQTAKLWCMSKLPMGRDKSSRRKKYSSMRLQKLTLHKMLVPDCAPTCVSISK